MLNVLSSEHIKGRCQIFIPLLIIIIITEHLILRPKMQANSKAQAFLLPIILALKPMSFQAYLEGSREKLSNHEEWMVTYSTLQDH